MAVAVVVIVTLAAFGHTVAGFGFSLLAVPPLGMVIDPKVAVVVAAFLLMMNSALLAWGERRHIDWRGARLLLLGALPGLPLGLLLLEVISVAVLRIGLAAAIVTSVVILGRGLQVAAGGAALEVGAGFATGVLTTSINANGPPTVMALQARGLAPQAFRPTTSAVLGLASGIGLMMFVVAGRVTGDVVAVVGAAGPALVAGWFCGCRVRGRVAPEVFRRLILGLLLVAALATFVAALG